MSHYQNNQSCDFFIIFISANEIIFYILKSQKEILAIDFNFKNFFFFFLGCKLPRCMDGILF